MGIYKKISIYIYIKGEHIYKNSLFSKHEFLFREQAAS